MPWYPLTRQKLYLLDAAAPQTLYTVANLEALILYVIYFSFGKKIA